MIKRREKNWQRKAREQRKFVDKGIEHRKDRQQAKQACRSASNFR